MGEEQAFENTAVAEAYRARPEYPPDLYAALVDLTPARSAALDLGCGTGKIARNICHAFQSVVGVDASSAMLEVARSMAAETQSNIAWVQGLAEEVSAPPSGFDLIVAGASIHWMNHARLFPRLLRCASNDYTFAVVDGDGATNPPWQAAWDLFLTKWIWDITGTPYQPDNSDSAFAKRMARHHTWLDALNTAHFEHEVSQSVEQFVLCQHSRATFTYERLGTRADDFDRELEDLLAPHAQDGTVQYTVRSSLEWGKILPKARPV